MKISIPLAAVMALGACTNTNTYNPADGYERVQPSTMMSAPASRRAGESTDQVRRGRYLVELVGCGTCHTDGALIGEPRSDRWLAGSRVGIAHSDPLETRHPGVSFPPNLTPDKKTGLGRWTDEDMVRKIRTGIDRHGSASLPVMPWPAYTRLSDPDVSAIVAYLRSLPAVSHAVPDAVPEGMKTRKQYVHFGIYRNRR